MSAAVINYFTVPAAAARYARSRTRGHERVLARLEMWLAGLLPVSRALDVGCGTGHSTHALLPYARTIVGLDPSLAMLAEAPRDPRISYHQGVAETMPFRDGEFELVTVSSAFHWLDHELFLREAARVSNPGGWLVVYKNGSSGSIPERPEFERWRRQVLRARFPSVTRRSEPLTEEMAARFGFDQIVRETLSFRSSHDLGAYADNLMTHSNLIRAIDAGDESPAEVRRWLCAQLAPFFPDGRAVLTHESQFHLLRRRGDRDAGSAQPGSFS